MAEVTSFSFNLPPILEKHKISIGLLLLSLLILGGGVVFSFSNNPKSSVKVITPSPSTFSSKILVDVSGAVVLPGVYQLPSGCRLELAIKAAGGLTSEADKEYVAKNLNLASLLADGAKVYIPKKGEEGFQQGSASSANKININSALSSELETLSGIGPKTAEKIINGRPYQSIDDLLLRKIVGKSVFEKIKDKVGV